MLAVRSADHLLQFVSQSPRSEVSGQCPLPLGPGTTRRITARALAPLAFADQKTIYTLRFRLRAETLIAFARDPRLLGAEIGFFSVLHTWNQKLEHHPHVHSVVPVGGISPDGSRSVRPRYNFFLPVKAMATAFRGKFLDALRKAFAAGELHFPGQLKNRSTPRAFSALLRPCCRHQWVVYAK